MREDIRKADTPSSYVTTNCPVICVGWILQRKKYVPGWHIPLTAGAVACTRVTDRGIS
jgi:hypothetical protein